MTTILFRPLQDYFNKRLQPVVAKHGKSMIGWDEILDPTLPKDITIQSWRGRLRSPPPRSRVTAASFRMAITSTSAGPPRDTTPWTR